MSHNNAVSPFTCPVCNGHGRYWVQRVRPGGEHDIDAWIPTSDEPRDLPCFGCDRTGRLSASGQHARKALEAMAATMFGEADVDNDGHPVIYEQGGAL